ncbi:MAG: hypothetical protein P4N60_22130 [Verrucomicrobiae bacterium]|nr:hypothetical protein [Verrucomicrobiae bacterium]
MNSSNASKSIPGWQLERAAKLQRACLCIKAALQRGEKIRKAIRRTSRRYHGRPFRADSRHKLALTPATLRRLYDAWLKAGERPSAFKLGYRARPPYLPRKLVLRFAAYCAANRLPSVRVAWLKFSSRPQNGRAREFTYGQVTYSFSAVNFYRMQEQLRCIEQAQAELDRIKLATIAEITDCLPLNPPRRRIEPGNGFQI